VELFEIEKVPGKLSDSTTPKKIHLMIHSIFIRWNFIITFNILKYIYIIIIEVHICTQKYKITLEKVPPQRNLETGS
jgi:hypothetical protein